ncbi:MAG: sugar ABC transporter permease [Anaerolineae bacterium]|nr:sugar ABC transporter permease [Anaerolineae bacterium]
MATTTVPNLSRPVRTGPVDSNRTFKLVIQLIVVLLGVAFALYPFIIIVSSSFNPANSISGQQLIPDNASFANYDKLLKNDQTPVLRWLINSIIVSGLSTVMTLIMTTLAAFSFSRFRYKGRQATLLATLVIQVFPNVIALTAFYLLLQQVGKFAPALGLNSLGGLILIYAGGALGANAWLMKGYFDTIPRDLDESAQVDGATHWTTFMTIILPLIRPILAVVGLLSFIGTFNDFLLPRVLLRDKDTYTLAVGLTTFLNNQFALNWGVFAAGAIIGTLPIIILFLVLQTQIIGGLAQGAVKG